MYYLKKPYKPCYASYDMNVLDPLGEPIFRGTMCRAPRTVRFREYFVAINGRCSMEKAITDLSFCVGHAMEFLVSEMVLVEKYEYKNGIQRPFCQKIREMKEVT